MSHHVGQAGPLGGLDELLSGVSFDVADLIGVAAEDADGGDVPGDAADGEFAVLVEP